MPLPALRAEVCVGPKCEASASSSGTRDAVMPGSPPSFPIALFVPSQPARGIKIRRACGDGTALCKAAPPTMEVPMPNRHYTLPVLSQNQTDSVTDRRLTRSHVDHLLWRKMHLRPPSRA